MVTIAVVIPTIPPRREELKAVRAQVVAQTRPADEVITWVDVAGAGAAISRNLGMQEATAEFIAFFDDDDVMYPRHLELLEWAQAKTRADLVYPWHDIIPPAPNPLAVRGRNPYGRPFDLAARRQILDHNNFIPIPVLVRRNLMLSVGGFTDFGLDIWDPSRCEVLDAWRKLLRRGARFVHCPYKTWAAVRNGENTAGLHWQTHVGTKQWAYDEEPDE